MVTSRQIGSISPFEYGHTAQSYNQRPLSLLRSLNGHCEFYWPVHGELVHQNNTRLVTKSNQGSIIANVDALITRVPLLPLVTRGADCSSVAFYDPENHVAALAHMGRAGIALNIAKKVVERLSAIFGSRSQNLLVAIGPLIGACGRYCYEVSLKYSQPFEKYPGSIVGCRDGKAYLNLEVAIKQQLLALGIPIGQIEDSGRFCTRCHLDKLFSRRAEPQDTACHAGILVLLPVS